MAISIAGARFLGPSGLGRQSFIAFVVATSLQVFGVGMPVALMRTVGEAVGAERRAEAQGLVLWGWRIGVACGALAGGVIVEAGLRSGREDRWRQAYEKAGSGDLEALRTADPELVEEDSAALGAALGRVLDALTDGGRALIVGHSPTNEAAVLGLTGQIVGPISKGAGVLFVADDQGYRLETLD